MKKNILIVALIVLVIFNIIGSSIVSHNGHHLDTCTVENCQVCQFIQFAQYMVNLFLSIQIYIISLLLIYVILSRLHKDNKIFVLNSLIFQKVQLNE